MDKRKRFEVFKRDKFTCQYCGKSAPDVILEVDHICPVSKGGTDDLINLVTSCRDCNRGKSNIELSDDTRVTKERRQLLELAEKQEQVEMMVEWKRKLQESREREVTIIEEEFERLTNGYVFSDKGREKIKKTIKKYSVESVLSALYKAVDHYFDKEDSDNSSGIVVDKIGSICYWEKTGDDRRWYYYNYLKKAMTNKGWYCNAETLKERVFEGITDDQDFQLAKFCLNARSWSGFWDRYWGDKNNG